VSTVPLDRARSSAGGASVIQAVGDRIKVGLEEVGIDVERHRGTGVSEHALHCLDVRARTHGEAGGGVAKLVRRQARLADRGGRTIES
jgi:hypothetical protein